MISQDFDVVNVDFEFFNFSPDIDFHGVKTLLRQLFDVDAPLFDLSALTDVILAQSTIGSTVKVDSKEADAYAFLTALNTKEHRESQPVLSVINYLTEKAKTKEALAPVADVLASDKPVGLILTERLINMPSEIAPPMYTMLIDEIEAAVEDKEPYEFSHYLIVSKTYHEVESTLDEGSERKRKKAKSETPLMYFHPEVEVFQKHALASGSYEYTKEDEASADSKRAFQEMGVKPQGYMVLVEASKFESAVKAAAEALGASS